MTSWIGSCCCALAAFYYLCPSKKKEREWIDRKLVWGDKEEVSEVFHRWTVEDKVVTVIQTVVWQKCSYDPPDPNHPPKKVRMHDNNWKCLVEDRSSHTSWESEMQWYKTAEELLQFKPIVEKDGAVTFGKPIHTWSLNPNVDVHLLKRAEKIERKGISLLKLDMVWYTFNKRTNTGQVDPIEFPESVSRKNRVYYALSHQLQSRHPGYVMVAAQTQSLMDPKVVLEGHRWAVTLADTGYSGSINPLSWFGHAVIIIEGVKKNGSYFMALAHMRENNASKKAEVLWLDQIPPREIVARCKEKTRTWQKAASRVVEMIRRIRWEIEMQNQGKPQVFFHIRGSHAIGVRPQKTGEYATEKEWEEASYSIPGRDMENHFTPAFFHSEGNDDNCPSLLDEEFWRKYSERNPGCRFVKLSPSTKRFEEFIMPDNCTTWAIKKLYMAGVDLPAGNYSKVAIGPRAFTRSKDPFTQWEELKHSGPDLPPLLEPIEEHDIVFRFKEGKSVVFTQETDLWD